MKEISKKLKGQVIISCQAYEDTPLYGPMYMEAMAKCAIMGGAIAVRSCWSQDIKAIRALSKDLIIVGINKKIIEGKEEGQYPIITPTYKDAKEVIEAGCDIVALDCTIFPERGKEEIYSILKKIHDNYPDIAIMADTGRVEDAVFAAESGFVDIVGTTLSEYYTHSGKFDDQLIKEYKEKCPNVLINAEGKIWELSDVQKAIDAGADMVSIGSAVSRPHLISQRFINYNQNYRNK